MIAIDEQRRHKEVWLLLPWLANARLSPAERETAEAHVGQCTACQQELEVQQLMCKAFTAPDRVVYAPGPSLRKLMDRVDADSGHSRPVPVSSNKQPNVQSLTARLGHVSLWRPPGLAWAASFLLLFGMTGVMLTAYHRWSAPTFRTFTRDVHAVNPNVLHIWLDRSVPIGEVEELLRANGARIEEAPSNTGVLGVTPIGIVPGKTSSTSANQQLLALSARLLTDPRVLWVQPLTDDGTPADQQVPDAANRRAADAQEH
jgi:hypothetical protein